MNRANIINTLDHVCDNFPVYQGFAEGTEQKLKLTYEIEKETPENEASCHFCDFPLWLVTFKYPIIWSNDTITYHSMTVNIHNFIEIDEVIGFSEPISAHHIKQLLTLSAILCKAFNHHN